LKHCSDCGKEFKPKTRSQKRCEDCINKDLASEFRLIPAELFVAEETAHSRKVASW